MGALLALAGLLQVALSLKIAAFNIRTFGETKMSNATLSHYIVQILSRYDIAVVQEVRDSHLTAVGRLLDALNRDDPDTYHYVVSEPLGRSSYKERYLFLFRPDQVTVLDSYQYDDGCEPCGNDTFSREPAIVRFHSPLTKVQEFAIVPLHAAPLDAVAEMDLLYDVYLDVRQKWDLEDIMLLGDFNAGCSYVAPTQWASIRLRTSPAFQWLIPDTADTTSTATHCAYDRIVVAGTVLQHAIVPDSAAPFDFQAAYGLSNQLVCVLPFSSPGALACTLGTCGCLCSVHRQKAVGAEQAIPCAELVVRPRPHWALPHRPRPSAITTQWR